MDVQALKSLIDSKADIELIDVRENYERAVSSIGGKHIPMSDLFEMLGVLPRDKQVIVYCNSGQRGAAVEHGLKCKGIENIVNLDGGLNSWRSLIDPSLPSD